MKNTNEERDSGILSNPLSFIRGGYFSWGSANIGTRGGNGYSWSPRSTYTTNTNVLVFSSANLNPQSGLEHGFGFAVLTL